jgi:hypothetical protein
MVMSNNKNIQIASSNLMIGFNSIKGKILHIPSPIDIEIKKPLVIETLKLAAPRRKIEKMYIN